MPQRFAELAALASMCAEQRAPVSSKQRAACHCLRRVQERPFRPTGCCVARSCALYGRPRLPHGPSSRRELGGASGKGPGMQGTMRGKGDVLSPAFRMQRRRTLSRVPAI